MPALGVLIVHPDEHSRRAVRAVTNATPGVEAVGDAATAEEALELAVELRPGLALIATEMPGIDGIETSWRLKAALPDTEVVLLYNKAKLDGGALEEAGAADAVRLDLLSTASLQTFTQSLDRD